MKNLGFPAFLLPLLAAAAGCASERSNRAGDEPMTNDDALVVWCAGRDALLSDPLDAGLCRALSMADDRLLELPAELGKPAVPGPLFRLIFDALAAPLSLRFDPLPGAEGSPVPPIEAQLTVHGTRAEAQAIGAQFAAVVGAMLPAPASPAEIAGLSHLPTPAGEVFFGVPGDVPERFVVSLGAPDCGALGLGSLDLPAGVEPILAFKLDFGRLRPLLDLVFAQAGPAAEPMRAQLEAVGLLGTEPLLVTAAVGRERDRLRFASRVVNYTALAERTGALVTEPLTAAELCLVPADATTAALYKTDFSALIDQFEAAIPQEELDLRGLARAMLGFDLDADLFDHLGTTAGYYLSETTGGGGLASLVVFVAVSGRDELGATGDLLQGMLNDLATGEARGYVRIRDWQNGEHLCHSLSFPGLPIPLEPSLALIEGWLLAAATPQALVAAIEQAAGSGPGLAAHPGFRAAEVGPRDDLLSVSFTDTAAALPGGYGLAALVASALANGVRSPASPDRDPGLVLPPYLDLAKGARATVAVSRLVGNDLVTLGEADGSMVVNTTALLGHPFGKLLLAGGALAALAPVFLMARVASFPD
ncbi:MAG: hypothetical protein AB1726_13840 [Planctomycetota bacterium]